MKRNWNILLKGLAAIGAVIVISISISRMSGIGSETLGDIAREHPQPTAAPRETPGTMSDTAPGANPMETPGHSSPIPDGSTEISHNAGESSEPSAGGAAAGATADAAAGMTGGSAAGTTAGAVAGATAGATAPMFPDNAESLPANVPESGNGAYNMENMDAAGADHGSGNDNMQNLAENNGASLLTGLSLNGELMADARITWEDGFYYEPLSDGLTEYITGISYPAHLENPAITADELSYVHVLYRNFDAVSTEGELICNQSIAQDLVEIFYELYKAEYQIEKIRLIDVYDGDDDLSMADNNTSCFNYRVVSGSSSLSKHAYGLAIDINPLYNPYITYNKDQTVNVAPAAGEDFADRSKAFPYKIDEDDLCCRLFKEHGFTWGGNWNSCKDYQHFQKTP